MPVIDVERLTSSERAALRALLDTPLTPEQERLAAARDALAAKGVAGVYDDDELAAQIRMVLVDLSQHPRHLGLRVRSTRFETRDETRSTAMRFVRFVGMVRRRLSSKN